MAGDLGRRPLGMNSGTFHASGVLLSGTVRRLGTLGNGDRQMWMSDKCTLARPYRSGRG